MANPLLSPAYELADGDKAFLAEIFESMLTSIPADIANIEKAVENNQLNLVRRSAHHMKSSIMYTNATELKGLLNTIEATTEHPEAIEQAEALLSKIKELANQLITTIKAEGT